jgi:hypothetical protein
MGLTTAEGWQRRPELAKIPPLGQIWLVPTAIWSMSEYGGFVMLMMRGDFTFWKYLKNLQPRDFERTLGFDSGRLADGFAVIVMHPGEILSENDFILQASTRWSGNEISKTKDPAEEILSRRGIVPVDSRKKVLSFIGKSPDNTPAKVIMNLEHQAGMKYPDAEALALGTRSGVPSFNLRMPKRALLARLFGSDYRLTAHRHSSLPPQLLA